jgi:uncharacterized protein YbjT (DUF2867 family)
MAITPHRNRLICCASLALGVASSSSADGPMAGRRADFIGNADLPHTYSYVPDIAAGLATLGTDARAAGQIWHLPGPQTVTTRALLDLVAVQVGRPVGIRSVPKLALRVLGLINPMLRGLAEKC